MTTYTRYKLHQFLERLNLLPTVHELLAQRRQIALIWSVEDVLEIRPDLTGEQAWRVLRVCDSRMDCNLGVTWETLELVADTEFPLIRRQDDLDNADSSIDERN